MCKCTPNVRTPFCGAPGCNPENGAPVVNIIFKMDEKKSTAGKCFEDIVDSIRVELMNELMAIPADQRTVPVVHKKIQEFASDRLFNILVEGYDVTVDIPSGPRSIQGRDILV